MPFGLIILAFNIWMLVDAIRRGADYYWLMIIAFIPGGSLIYFFLVRMRDPDVRRVSSRLKEIATRPVRVEVLQARFDDSPSAANEIALAQGLGEDGRWKEATEHFENVLKGRPKDPEALFGYGICLLESERPREAVAPFSRLVDDHSGYRDYAAYPELGTAYQKLGLPEEAVELFRSLYRQSPRLRHAVWLAEALLSVGETSEAKELLDTALRQSDDGPAHAKRADRPWRRQAERMFG
ncbi:MAG TPA: tetratricopeptide repeat protein [Polyangiaceae bacterium]|nr:tetratricopeptide repeat protein [Polyangiaceae bacterium]